MAYEKPTITVDTDFTTSGPPPEKLDLDTSHKDYSQDARKLLEDALKPIHNTPVEEENSKGGKTKKPKQSSVEKKAFVAPSSTEGTDFKYSARQLECLIDPKNAHVLAEMGGIEELCASLHTDMRLGLTDSNLNDKAELDTRLKLYGRNVLPDRKPKSLLRLMWIAFQDKVLIILTIAAVVSLALGLYETFGQPAEYDKEGHKMPKVDWVEGVAIIIAVVIVVMVGSINDWQKEKQFVKLNKKKDDRTVKVIRNGVPSEISVYDVMVGDLLMAEPGEMIPVDGVLIKGDGVICDESSASGESDALKKHPAAEVALMASQDAYLSNHSKKLDAFMLSGARVLEGTGVYLVLAVGTSSMNGRTMLSLQEEAEATPLQAKLDRIAEGIAKFGLLAAVILFVALMIRFFVDLKGSKETSAKKGEDFLTVLITSITIVVVAVPEGLPLAVTLALAFATTRMLKDNNLVRVLKSCETMGNATSICSDKTGTLTQNKMTVVAGTLGLDSQFKVNSQSDASSDSGSINEESSLSPESGSPFTQPIEEPTFTPQELLNKLSDQSRTLLMQSICLNSSAFEAKPEDREAFVGSKTEVAMLTFARDYLSLSDISDYRERANIVKVFPFDSKKKFMVTVVGDVQKPDTYTVLLKGASEVVLAKCSQIMDPFSSSVQPLTIEVKNHIIDRINTYASHSLRTIGMVINQISAEKFKSLESSADGDALEEELLSQCTFFGLVGIQDPLRPGVRNAVNACKTAGVVVRMVTGDNINTGKAIARECNILTDELINGESEIAMEGPEFRKLDVFEMSRIVPRLRVLARSSPQDKKKLVQFLKSNGEVVAVTGDGINDVPALKAADIGFSMGIAGTEVAKEASEIILMDDNFGSIVKAMMWGRTVTDAVKKFLQFQLTVNITAVLLTFVSAVASSANESVLTAVQLLWINLIMDTFAALALATDPPAPSVLLRKPDARGASLISVTMWKMILGQAILQLIITFVLHFAGTKIFFSGEKEVSSAHNEELSAMVFNAFVWLQFFNMFVNRRLDNKQNIFEGIHKNFFFIAIAIIIGGCQIVIMFVGGAAFSIHRQTGAMWGTAIICGILSIPCGMLLRMIPDSFVSKLYPKWMDTVIYRLSHIRGARGNPDIEIHYDDSVTGLPQYKWNEGIEMVRDDLKFLKKVRGGRLYNLNVKPQKIYSSIRGSLSPFGGSSDHSQSPVSTLRSSSFHGNTSGTVSGLSADVDTTSHVNTGSAGTTSSGAYLTLPSSGHSTGGRGRHGSSSPGRAVSPTLSVFAMVPTVVGGAIAGWSPQEVSSSDEETNNDRSNVA